MASFSTRTCRRVGVALATVGFAVTAIGPVGIAWADDAGTDLVPGPVAGCPPSKDLFQISGSSLGKVLRPKDKNQDDFVCVGPNADLTTGHGVTDNHKPL